MKLEISGQDVLNLVSNRLNHLLACREFLTEFLKHKLDVQLIDEQAKDKYKHNQTKLKDALAAYQKLCQDHALADEVNPSRSSVQRWLDDVEELEAVEYLVKHDIDDASGGPYGEGLPYPLKDRLRHLNNFDDSE